MNRFGVPALAAALGMRSPAPAAEARPNRAQRRTAMKMACRVNPTKRTSRYRRGLASNVRGGKIEVVMQRG